MPLVITHVKARALLFFLAATGQLHTRDYLATLLWSETGSKEAHHSLRNSIYLLRKALRASQTEAVLTVDGELVGLQPGEYGCDVIAFRRLLADDREQSLAQAVELYRGPLLQGFTLVNSLAFEVWVQGEEAHLSQACFNAFDRLAAQAESRGAWSAATGYAQGMIQINPFAEMAQQRLMRFYLNQGEASLVLRQFRRFEKLLKQELGVAPSPETQSLFFEALRRQRGTKTFAEISSQNRLRQPQAVPYSGRESLLHRLATLSQEVQAVHGTTFDEMIQLTRDLGSIFQSRGQLKTAAHWHQQTLDWAIKAADLSAQAGAKFEMGELALMTHDYQSAIRAAREGLSKIESRDPTVQIQVLAGRGHRLLGAAFAMEGSDLASAEGHLQLAVAAHRQSGKQDDLCAALFELGNVAAQRGELSRALDFYQDAAGAAKSGGIHYYLALACNNFAYHSLLLGQIEAAQQSVLQGIKVAETYDLITALLHLYSTQGEIHLYLGEWADAEETFRRGLDLAEGLGSLERQAGYRGGLALAARGRKDLFLGIRLLQEALALIAGQGYWHLRTRLQIWYAEMLFEQGRSVEMAKPLDEAIATAGAQNRTLLLVEALRVQARRLATGGDWAAANGLFAEALENAARLNLPLEVARLQAAWGLAALEHSDTPDKGRALLDTARSVLVAHDARADLATLV